MEQYINYIAEFFQKEKFDRHEETIRVALQEYFGIKEQATTELALQRLEASFQDGGTGINRLTITQNEDGSYRLEHIFAFDIRAEYLPLLPILAMRLGYNGA